MSTYELYRHEVIAPAVKNNGVVSHYGRDLGQALIEAGFNWTATETRGAWNGKIEPGTQFTIYTGKLTEQLSGGKRTAAGEIARIARKVMSDQEAIQVVVDPNPITLIEA